MEIDQIVYQIRKVIDKMELTLAGSSKKLINLPDWKKLKVNSQTLNPFSKTLCITQSKFFCLGIFLNEL